MRRVYCNTTARVESADLKHTQTLELRLAKNNRYGCIVQRQKGFGCLFVVFVFLLQVCSFMFEHHRVNSSNLVKSLSRHAGKVQEIGMRDAMTASGIEREG